MLETVDGSGSGGVFVDENQASCGSILATGNLHLSPIGAVLQQAREPKPAAGERPAIAGARSPKIWDAPIHFLSIDRPAVALYTVGTAGMREDATSK